MVRYHNHAFWIYGVIVALAIREALSTVIPHTIPLLAQNQIASQPEPKNQLMLEAIRLVLFLAMTIRFYLGSCRYFDQVYCADDSKLKFPRANYSMDFVLGLLHFLLFFTWSETLITHDRLRHGLSGFLLIMGMILGFDVFWLLLSWGYDTRTMIGRWAFVNAITLLVAIVIALVTNYWQLCGERTAEVFTGIPVGLTTLVDFGEMFGGNNILTDWISNIFPPQS